MSRRVLIVSPNFPPINAADHQRVRMSLPHFREYGWEPSVLAVHPDSVEGVREPLLEELLPEGIDVTRAGALPVERSRRFGVGNLGLRSWPYLRRLGAELIRARKIDLVYFSTTMFPVMSLGPVWNRRYGVPYVLDFQDPWLNDYHKGRKGFVPPGGRLKYGSSQLMARVLEPYSLRRASHVISVSPAYPKALLRRYPWLRGDRFTVLPFGASSHDFQLVSRLGIQQHVFDKGDGRVHWVYVGRGGGDMSFALRAFFRALRRARDREPGRFGKLMLHFIGTDYAPEGRAKKTVAPVAAECGVADIVREYPKRIPYFEALKCLLDADALIVPGSDDAGYTASKIYPYILAEKPLLAVFHEESSVVGLLRATGAGAVVTFRAGDEVDDVSGKIEADWFGPAAPPAPATDWEAFEPYTAREMTRRQCEVFDGCLDISQGGVSL